MSSFPIYTRSQPAPGRGERELATMPTQEMIAQEAKAQFLLPEVISDLLLRIHPLIKQGPDLSLLPRRGGLLGRRIEGFPFAFKKNLDEGAVYPETARQEEYQITSVGKEGWTGVYRLSFDVAPGKGKSESIKLFGPEISVLVENGKPTQLGFEWTQQSGQRRSTGLLPDPDLYQTIPDEVKQLMDFVRKNELFFDELPKKPEVRKSQDLLHKYGVVFDLQGLVEAPKKLSIYRGVQHVFEAMLERGKKSDAPKGSFDYPFWADYDYSPKDRGYIFPIFAQEVQSHRLGKEVYKGTDIVTVMKALGVLLPVKELKEN